MNREVGLKRKRKMYYVSNVLIVKDSQAPEKNGRVFLDKYGATIMGKIEDAITPNADAQAIDPFDPEEGANLCLRTVRTGGFADYSKSTFESPSSIGDEDMIASVMSKRRSLAAIIHPSQFNSYVELKRKFDLMVGDQKAA